MTFLDNNIFKIREQEGNEKEHSINIAPQYLDNSSLDADHRARELRSC